MLKPNVATAVLGLSSSPAMTSLNGSAIISLVKMYSLLSGFNLSSILDLKSTGSFSSPTFRIKAAAVSFLLSAIFQTSIRLFQYLVISVGVFAGSGISNSFFTVALVILQGFPNLDFNSAHMSSYDLLASPS